MGALDRSCEDRHDSEAAAESDADDRRALLTRSEKAAVRAGAPRSPVVGGAAAVVLAVGVLSLVATRGRSAARASADGAISGASALPGLESRSFCRNWDVIRLALLEGVASEELCRQECRGRAGCSGFSYQPGACKALSGKGRCYLWNGECDHRTNECWDTYNLSETERKPASWRKTGSRYGCSNWREAKIADPTIEISAGACATKCADTKGCVGINFQPGRCSGKEMVKKGSCYMWKQRCRPESNSCWDLYEQLVSTVLISAHSVGDMYLDVESEDGFEVGDRVVIQSPLFSEMRTLEAVGPLTFTRGSALGHDYPAGSTVTTPVKPIRRVKSPHLQGHHAGEVALACTARLCEEAKPQSPARQGPGEYCSYSNRSLEASLGSKCVVTCRGGEKVTMTCLQDGNFAHPDACCGQGGGENVEAVTDTGL